MNWWLILGMLFCAALWATVAVAGYHVVRDAYLDWQHWRGVRRSLERSVRRRAGVAR